MAKHFNRNKFLHVKSICWLPSFFFSSGEKNAKCKFYFYGALKWIKNKSKSEKLAAVRNCNQQNLTHNFLVSILLWNLFIEISIFRLIFMRSLHFYRLHIDFWVIATGLFSTLYRLMICYNGWNAKQCWVLTTF